MSETNQALYDLFNGLILLGVFFGAWVCAAGGVRLPSLGPRRDWRGVAREVKEFVGLGICLVVFWFVARVSWMALVCILQGLIKFGLLEVPRWGELRNTYTW